MWFQRVFVPDPVNAQPKSSNRQTAMPKPILSSPTMSPTLVSLERVEDKRSTMHPIGTAAQPFLRSASAPTSMRTGSESSQLGSVRAR